MKKSIKPAPDVVIDLSVVDMPKKCGKTIGALNKYLETMELIGKKPSQLCVFRGAYDSLYEVAKEKLASSQRGAALNLFYRGLPVVCQG